MIMNKSDLDYLDDLFLRLENDNLKPGLKLPEGVSYQSNLTFSWEAHKEAKNLSDKKWIAPLQERLDREKNTKEKINIINVLVPLADKCQEHIIADYILSIVKNEKTRWVRDVALSALNNSKLKINKEKEYLFELVKEKDWQITLNSLGLLKKLNRKYSNRIEETCLSLISTSQNKPHELCAICNVLAKHGDKKSIEAIKEICRNNSKAFLVNSAIHALEEINGNKEIDFFVEIFNTNRNKDVKPTITKALCRFGDENIIEILIKRAKTIVTKKRKTEIIYLGDSKPEIIYILEFLTKMNDQRINELIDFIRFKKIDNLDKTELKWFNKNILNKTTS